MAVIRKAQARGHFNHGWLDTHHTFSFGAYLDRAHMGFRSLRVINEDRVVPGAGFSTHAHQDMEIITYVISGALAHKDSMGNGSTIPAGHVQVMSAGTGITHSEFNASDAAPVHFLQIWIQPKVRGVPPRYAEWEPPAGEPCGWHLAVSGAGEVGVAPIHQDARMFIGHGKAGEALALPHARAGWLQVVSGEVAAGGALLSAGDGLAFEAGEVSAIDVRSEFATLLLFELL